MGRLVVALTGDFISSVDRGTGQRHRFPHRALHGGTQPRLGLPVPELLAGRIHAVRHQRRADAREQRAQPVIECATPWPVTIGTPTFPTSPSWGRRSKKTLSRPL